MPTHSANPLIIMNPANDFTLVYFFAVFSEGELFFAAAFFRVVSEDSGWGSVR
jgi:hypothetical protein